jgi:hypothetical protein
MDLSQFVKPFFTSEDSLELKNFHHDKVYSETETVDVKLRNLKFFWDYSCENLTRISSMAQELFSGLQYEGYLKTCVLQLQVLKENPNDANAFTMFQVAGMFVLQHDFSNFQVHFTQTEVNEMKQVVENAFLSYLRDTGLDNDRRCIIADCLLLASCSYSVKQEAQSLISRVRDHQPMIDPVHQPARFTELEAPQPPKKRGVKDLSVDSQNVHSSNISSVVKRKLLKLQADTIPSKKEFKSIINGSKRLKTEHNQSEVHDTTPNEYTSIPVYFGTKLIKLQNMFTVEADGRKMVTDLDMIKYLRSRNMIYNPDQQDQQAPTRVEYSTDISLSDGFIPQTLDDIENVAMKFFEQMFGKCKKIEAFSRISTDTVVFAPSTLTLAGVFQRIFNRVMSQVSKDYFPDLIQRVYEELKDSEGVCATGYVSRLLNILQGYPEIDLEVVDSYEEDIFKEIQTMFELQIEQRKKFGTHNEILEAEKIEDGLISFNPEERKPFEEYFKSVVYKWYMQMFDKFVKNMQVYSGEWFDEDFSKMVHRFSTIKIQPEEFTKYRKLKTEQPCEHEQGNIVTRLINRLFPH